MRIEVLCCFRAAEVSNTVSIVELALCHVCCLFFSQDEWKRILKLVTVARKDTVRLNTS